MDFLFESLMHWPTFAGNFHSFLLHTDTVYRRLLGAPHTYSFTLVLTAQLVNAH
jgi:hypothetical protein